MANFFQDIVDKSGSSPATSNDSGGDNFFSGVLGKYGISAPKSKFNVQSSDATPKSDTATFSGKGYGAAPSVDPYSGRSFLTVPVTIPKTFASPEMTISEIDPTRTAPGFDPTIPRKIDSTMLDNGRLPESASQKIKAQMERDGLNQMQIDELDHVMPLELGGSNDTSNLKLSPGRKGFDIMHPSTWIPSLMGTNAEQGDAMENRIGNDVRSGKISLLDGWRQMAQYKGYTLKEDSAKNNSLDQWLLESPKTLNALASGQAAIGDVGDFFKNMAVGLYNQFTKPSPTEQEVEKHFVGSDVHTGNSTLDKGINSLAYPGKVAAKAFVRFFEPFLEPYGLDAGQMIGAREISDAIDNGTLPPDIGAAALDSLPIMQKTTLQIIGDAAQTALTFYMPAWVSETAAAKATAAGIEAATKPLVQRVGFGVMQGAKSAIGPGAAFGASQVLSGGETHIKDIISTMAATMIFAEVAGAATGGISMGTASLTPEEATAALNGMKDKIKDPKIKDLIDRTAQKIREKANPRTEAAPQMPVSGAENALGGEETQKTGIMPPGEKGGQNEAELKFSSGIFKKKVPRENLPVGKRGIGIPKEERGISGLEQRVKKEYAGKVITKTTERFASAEEAGRYPAKTLSDRLKRLASRIENTLNTFTDEDKAKLPIYQKMNKKEQIEAAVSYVDENPDEAMKVLQGQKEPPKGILYNSIFLAMEETGKGDPDLALRLASLRSTRYGQEISILTERNPNSPVKYIGDLGLMKVEAGGGKEAIDRIKTSEIEKVKKFTVKSYLAQNDWNDFVRSISC